MWKLNDVIVRLIMRMFVTRLCLLLSLLIAGQGAYAALLQAVGVINTPASNTVMDYCQPDDGHKNPLQNCCRSGSVCPLLQVQASSPVQAVLDAGREPSVRPEMAVTRMFTQFPSPLLRPPILPSV